MILALPGPIDYTLCCMDWRYKASAGGYNEAFMCGSLSLFLPFFHFLILYCLLVFLFLSACFNSLLYTNEYNSTLTYFGVDFPSTGTRRIRQIPSILVSGLHNFSQSSSQSGRKRSCQLDEDWFFISASTLFSKLFPQSPPRTSFSISLSKA